ncbi:MAG: cytochrome d ubiquinol oxidase subunit II [Nitrospira sp.]|nr:cytochrome d ubiquinol oxidase subunit II [Nitrospira sp.]
METAWFIIVTLMLAMYVVLDGFDFGVGMVYPFIARTEAERKTALTSIGPVWNANEVWLIAAGAVLFFAYPKAYAAGFSGFYLALILVLWLLIFRGLALELRAQVDHLLWRQAWDAAFNISSVLLAIVFGTALGNLIRGVPLNQDGYFFVPLWTDFLPGSAPGILDWFTVLLGLSSAVILAFHGANYLAMKTDGFLHQRAVAAARILGWMSAGYTALTVMAVPMVQPSLALNFTRNPVVYLAPLIGAIALGYSLYFRLRRRDTSAFLASSLFIFLMLASVMFGMYPYILVSTTDRAFSLTVFNASTDSYGLTAGIGWFVGGFLLILAYQVYLHSQFLGKVRSDDIH